MYWNYNEFRNRELQRTLTCRAAEWVSQSATNRRGTVRPAMSRGGGIQVRGSNAFHHVLAGFRDMT